MISAIGYGIWKMNKEIEKITKVEPQTVLPKKTKEIDISNWNTYKNERYRFEIKYPGEISKISETSDRKSIKFYYKESPFNKFPAFIDSIEIEKKPREIPFDLLLHYWEKESLNDEICPGCFKVLWQELATLSGKPAIIALVSSHPTPTHIVAMIQLNEEEILSISIFLEKTSSYDLKMPPTEEKEAFYQIISTLKFF